MASPYQPTPGANSRRQLFTQRILHGSEERIDTVSPNPGGLSTPVARSAPDLPIDYVRVLTDIMLPSPAAPSDAIPDGAGAEAEAAAPTVHPEQ